MKEIKKIVVSIGIIVLLLIILEKIYDFFIFQNKNLKTNYISSEKINADILFEGSCIPYQTISPEIIKSSSGYDNYNLASNHSDLAENYLNIYLYLKNNSAPKIVCLFTGAETFDENYNGFNSYRYVSFVNEPEINKIIADLDPNYHKYLWIPFMKYAYYNSKITFPTIQGVKHYSENKHLPYLIDGYESPFKIINEFKPKFKDLYKKQKEFKWSKKREFYFYKIIKICKLNNIQLIIFDPPSLLIQLKNHQANRAQIRSRINVIAKKNNIPFLTFDSLDVCYKKEKFVSNYHLIEEESIKFNKMFAKIIKNKKWH